MKATDAGLEGFMNWTNLGVSESAKEEEVEMSGLVFGLLRGCASERLVLRGRLLLALKYLAESVPSCLA